MSPPPPPPPHAEVEVLPPRLDPVELQVGFDASLSLTPKLASKVTAEPVPSKHEELECKTTKTKAQSAGTFKLHDHAIDEVQQKTKVQIYVLVLFFYTNVVCMLGYRNRCRHRRDNSWLHASC
jgi:hypothetical protein